MAGFKFNRSSRRPAQPSHSYRPHHGTPPKRGFAASTHALDQQYFDYIIVVDFEATCERDRRTYPNEIIEFPAILIDVRRGIVDRQRSFQTYVKPWRNTTLTAFCTELTGITQSQVDNAPSMTEAIDLFVKWFKETIPYGAKVTFATDGPWDFKNFLFQQAVLRDHVSFPTIFYEYFDVRTTWSRTFNKGDPLKLDAMLKRMKLRFEGNPHCGFDDAYNIARLALEMMKKGCVFEFLIALPLNEEDFHYSLEGYPVYRREEGSGFITKEHVEEVAKAAFGRAYFDFAQRHLAEVAAYRETGNDGSSQTLSKALKTRRDGGLLSWQQKRQFAVLLIVALLCGAIITTLVIKYAGLV